MRVLLLLSGLLLSLSLLGQIPQPANSLDMAARRQCYMDSGRQQARHDSLERLFNQEPPYVVVSYYQNARQLPWSAAMQLYLQIGSQRLMLQPDGDNRFLLPSLGSDSLTLGVRYRGQNIVFSKEAAWHFTHGATVKFGRFNRAYLKRDYREQWADGSYCSSAPLLPVLDSVRVVQWRQAKQVRGVQYRIVVPRVYGDGAVQTSYAPLLR